MIAANGGILRHVLTINIIDILEPLDCTADPQFSSGTGMIHHFLIVYFQQLQMMKEGRLISPAGVVAVTFIMYIMCLYEYKKLCADIHVYKKIYNLSMK